MLSAGVCILIANLIGYFSGNYTINAVSPLGGFTFLHYTSREHSRIMKRLGFVGMMLVASYVLGLLSTVYILMSPQIIDLITFISRLLFELDKPGDLFVIFCAAAGASNPIQLSEVAELSLYFFFGVALSLLLGYLSLKVGKAPKQSLSCHFNLIECIRQEPRSIIDSLSYAITLFFASYINLAVGLD